MLHYFRQSPKIVEARWDVKAWVQVLVQELFPQRGMNSCLKAKYWRGKGSQDRARRVMVSRICSACIPGAPGDHAFPAAPASFLYWSSHAEGQGLCFTMCQGCGHREEEKEGRENAIALMGTAPGVPMKSRHMVIWRGIRSISEGESLLRSRNGLLPLSALLCSQVGYDLNSGYHWSGSGFQGPQI